MYWSRLECSQTLWLPSQFLILTYRQTKKDVLYKHRTIIRRFSGVRIQDSPRIIDNPSPQTVYWYFLISFFSLKKYCDGKLLVFHFNSLSIMQFPSQTSAICRTVFMFLSVKGPVRNMAQPRSPNPPKVRNNFLRGRGKNEMSLESLANAMSSPPFPRVTQTKHFCSLVRPVSAKRLHVREGWIVCSTPFCVRRIFFALAVKGQSY
jgi:hypothetical protein